MAPHARDLLFLGVPIFDEDWLLGLYRLHETRRLQREALLKNGPQLFQQAVRRHLRHPPSIYLPVEGGLESWEIDLQHLLRQRSQIGSLGGCLHQRDAGGQNPDLLLGLGQRLSGPAQFLR